MAFTPLLASVYHSKSRNGMHKLRTVIIDDEPNAIELIEHYLIRFFEKEVEIIGKFEMPLKGFRFLKNEESDLVFLDISMPELDGMDLLEMLPDRSFEVVFITAHAEHAVRAFQNAAINYLLKPIDRKEFVFSMEKTLQRVRKMRGHTGTVAESTLSQPTISIPVNGLNKMVQLSDILYFQAEGSYTRVVGKKEAYLISRNLKQTTLDIEAEGLIRINRSFIINVHHVTAYSKSNGGSVVMSNGYEIDISRSKKKRVLAYLDEWGKAIGKREK